MRTLLRLACLALAVLSAWGQTVVQNTTYNSGQTLAVTGPNTIQTGANVLVSSGANITYQAATSITLMPGFHAQTGSVFQTAIIGAPPAPSNVAEVSASLTSITLTWTMPSDPLGIGGYHIYRNGTLVGSTTSPVFTDSSVSSNTNYSYTVVAYDAGGNNSTATVAMTAATLGGTNGAGYPTAVLLILKTNPNNTQTDTSNQMSLEVLRPN